MFRKFIVLCIALFITNNYSINANAANPPAIKLSNISTALLSSQSFTSEQQEFFTISGSLENLSGGEIDFNNDVVCAIYAGGQLVDSYRTSLLPDQTFHFYVVPYNSQYTYLVSYTVNGIEFQAQEIIGNHYSSGATVDTRIWVFNTTSDTSLIRGEGMHVGLNFEKAGYVHVSESLIFYNPSSLVIIPADNHIPVIGFELDEQASSIQFLDDANSAFYKTTAGGFGDWQPIFPGAVHQVMFEYDLPFDGDAFINLRMPVHMESIMVMTEVKDGQITCRGARLTTSKMESAGATELLNGFPESEEKSLSIHCVTKNKLFPFLIGSGILILGLFIILWVVRDARKKMGQRKAAESEVILTHQLDAIIALEDQFKAGEISQESFEAKRAELIERLEGTE